MKNRSFDQKKHPKQACDCPGTGIYDPRDRVDRKLCTTQYFSSGCGSDVSAKRVDLDRNDGTGCNAGLFKRPGLALSDNDCAALLKNGTISAVLLDRCVKRVQTGIGRDSLHAEAY